jgi:quercetin dioxygenase-like cupin family protein
MSGQLNSNSRRTTATANATQVFSPQKNPPPTNQFLTEISDNEGDYCVMLCTLPAGAVVPMHSHADRETFYVLSGTPSALRDNLWVELGPGDVLDVRDGLKHGWKNTSQAPVSMLCVTTMKMARFLQDISTSGGDALSPEEHAQRFLNLVVTNGYWLASPEENAAVGLGVNWNGPHD